MNPPLRILLGLLACVCTLQAFAATVSAVVGRPVRSVSGEMLGPVDDLIVDVRAGRVLYVIVDGEERYYTLPMRAVEVDPSGLRLDMSEMNEVAVLTSPEPRFRRAARLIGQTVTNPGDGKVGTIRDIAFDAESGRVEDVLVVAEGAELRLPPSVLALGHFPPLTRWQAEHPPAEIRDRQGFLRREPSSERRRLHDHYFERD